MALIEMTMPKMGESIMEGTVLTWLKKEGDTIEQDEAVLEVATDKVDTEVPAIHAGVLRQILVQAGEVVPVGAPIAIIATEADAHAPAAVTPPADPAPRQAEAIEAQIGQLAAPPMLEVPATGRFYSPLVLTIAREEGISMTELERIPGSGGDNRVTKKDILEYVQAKNPGFTAPSLPPAEPLPHETAPARHASTADETLSLIARMKATDKHVPATPVSEPTVAETPAAGLPDVDDAEMTQEIPVPTDRIDTPQQPAAGTVQPPEMQSEIQPEPESQPEPVPVASEKSEPPAQPVANQSPAVRVSEPAAPVPAPAVSYSGRADIVEMDRMRKMIAQRMVDSKRISPHVTSFVEADMTNIVFWRNRVKQEFKTREGDTITFTPVFIEAIAKAIKDYPMINSSVEGDRIIVKKDINIGMAVALPSGNLIVPVIKNADQLNLVGLTKKVNDLARRARDGKLTADDLADGTYTMSNVGSFGNVMGTPIILQPQVGIMAFGAVQKKPAVIETPFGDTLGIRHLMFLSHSYDHRVVDGSLGGMFVRRVADYLEGFDVNRKIF